MSEKTRAEYDELSTRFIQLANEMTAEGKSKEMVNAALMSASGFYATFTAAGNDGGLTSSGVDQVAGIYKKNLKNVQQYKKKRLK